MLHLLAELTPLWENRLMPRRSALLRETFSLRERLLACALPRLKRCPARVARAGASKPNPYRGLLGPVELVRLSNATNRRVYLALPLLEQVKVDFEAIQLRLKTSEARLSEEVNLSLPSGLGLPQAKWILGALQKLYRFEVGQPASELASPFYGQLLHEFYGWQMQASAHPQAVVMDLHANWIKVGSQFEDADVLGAEASGVRLKLLELIHTHQVVKRATPAQQAEWEQHLLRRMMQLVFETRRPQHEK
ncbi:hypothetical protein [Deinococcus xinjiangensis]|uniref:hypothetical protein n=1 Tax=Deinococcus xinjiangensis TaxID=457454 RepID=UPI0033657ED1